VKQGLECARRRPPQLCEKDPTGGHCATATEDELACIVNCTKYGNTPGECNAVCAPYRWLPNYCSPSKILDCEKYITPSKCETDPKGGHCVDIPGYDQLKNNYVYCRTNAECKSGLCDRINFLESEYISIGFLHCLPPRICRPGTTIGPDKNIFSSCGRICSKDGREWLENTDDCTFSKPRYSRYCQDNIVIYEDIKNSIRLYGQECDGGCEYGACTTETSYRCQEGEFSYVKGSCSGISGCPDSSQSYDGNCLAKCNASGNWEITSACIGSSIESGFSNQERFKVLRTLSNYPTLDFPISFSRHNNAFTYDYVPSNTFIRQLLEKYLSEDYGTCGTAYTNGDVAIADCGTIQDVIGHEIAHLIAENNPKMFIEYASTVGCRQQSRSSEKYIFLNEPPVRLGRPVGNASENCYEAFSEAATYYQSASCEMKEGFPIQYEWMKINVYEGSEFCIDSQSNMPSNNKTYVANSPSSYTSKQPESVIFDNSFMQKISDKFSFTPLVHAQTTVPHKYSLSIGSSLSEVTNELGNPDKTEQIYGIKILTYKLNDPTLPNTFFFNSSNMLIYFRLHTNNLKFNFRTIERWLTDYGNPETISRSNVQTYSTKLMYPNSGFTIVVDDNSKKVIQYESFIPITQKEYLDTWGIDIYQSKVRPPKITPTPTPDAGGDGNGDGVVNIDDYVIWLNNYQEVLGGNNNGDYYPDDFIDGLDYTIWLNNFSN
jgi:hypothetical protein